MVPGAPRTHHFRPKTENDIDELDGVYWDLSESFHAAMKDEEFQKQLDDHNRALYIKDPKQFLMEIKSNLEQIATPLNINLLCKIPGIITDLEELEELEEGSPDDLWDRVNKLLKFSFGVFSPTMQNRADGLTH